MSKINRIEQGQVPVSPTDVKALLALYGVEDEARIDQMVELALDARRARSWPEFDKLEVDASFREMIALETSASIVWKYEAIFPPGYFQPYEYALSLLETLGFDFEEASDRANLRLKRQEVLDSDDHPEINVVISESALAIPAGTNFIMRELLERLVEANQHTQTSLYLIPFTAGTYWGMGVPFTILQFNDEDMNDVLFLEDAERKVASIEEDSRVNGYMRLFNRLREIAESNGNFADHIDRILDERYGGST